ncbi:Dehydrogenase [Tenacibaculum sp. 190524A02b]|uniref:Dehydrogenase n=1 Tax=Tenacibaculum vairaonense TaxID=3137860 RepID=A0ABM9PS84_9FLAO
MTQETEIVIIGGGIAGCIAALSLADTFKVTIIDKLEKPMERVGESLAPAAQRILKQLGLLSTNEESIENGLYINNIGMQSYWGSDAVQFVDHLKNPDGCSLSLDRQQFESYLRSCVVKKGITCFWGYRFFNASLEKSNWNLTIKNDDQKNRKEYKITSKLVIDATGRGSHFSRSIGIKRLTFDQLISCWISLPNTATNTMSTIVSDALGWWYSVVTPNNKRVLSFQTDPDLVSRTTFKHKTDFLKLVASNSKMQPLITNVSINDINFHGTVSANSTKLLQPSGKQWIALGDAAISFDPLSSQGMFNAMATAMQVTDLLIANNFIHQYSTEKMAQFSYLYSQQIEAIWQHYLKHKSLFYTTEKRWNKHPFWQRRQEGISIVT